MEFLEEKTFRIGVDWITIYDFEIDHDTEKVFKLHQETDDYYQERIYIDEPLFTLNSNIRFYNDGQIKAYKTLKFNPNRLLYGHNIHNSRSEEIKQALGELKRILHEKGIEISFENANVRDLEINMNFKRDFTELKEALTLLFLGLPGFIKISECTKAEAFKNLFRDQTLEAKWNTYKVKAYCKNSELRNRGKILKPLGVPITRLEWTFEKSVYNYFCKKRGFDTSLEYLLNNFEIVELMFKEYSKREMFKKSYSDLSERIVPNLESGYLNFKKKNKLGRELGKKELRDVYKFLEDSYWIFDTAFLKQVVSKHDKKHKKREIDRIEKRHFHHNNLEKLSYLMEIIFTPLIPNSGALHSPWKSCENPAITKAREETNKFEEQLNSLFNNVLKNSCE